MKGAWDMFTDDDVDEVPKDPPMNLLPSSLREVWGGAPAPVSPSENQVSFYPGSFETARRSMQISGSAPQRQFMDYGTSDVVFQGEIERAGALVPRRIKYYRVKFNMNRSAVFQANQKLKLSVGDYVLTEADRGYDVGRITALVKEPTVRDIKGAKMIVRTATQHEVQQLPQKTEREARALALCQAKAAELGLPMNITGAEFQFDGKKLSFYYTAPNWVDFRVLVRTLFRMFGTRIWMVWYSGEGQEQTDMMAPPPDMDGFMQGQ